MDRVIDFLTYRAKEKKYQYKTKDFKIQGFWKSEYLLYPNRKERRFHLHYILAQTKEQGCSYYDPICYPIELSDSYIGIDALDLIDVHLPIRIAALDSAYGIFKDSSDKSFKIKGKVAKKASKRAEIVYLATNKLIETKQLKGKPQIRILNIGVVSNILKLFAENDEFDVYAADFDERLIGKNLFGVVVENGEKTLDLLSRADIAIITGMTLATNTLDDIIRIAKINNTKLVMFAETGANFGREYCNFGIDVVISEPFPFYMVANGISYLELYFR